MMKYGSKLQAISLALCAGGLALTACSTQSTSTRYGAGQVGQAEACGRYETSCEMAHIPGGYVVEHYQIQQPAYQTQTCCFEEPSVVYTPPPVAELPPPEPSPPPPVYTPPPPVVAPPPVAPLPPVITPPPPLRPSCPEGTIPGYGAEGCVPITIPRK